MNKKGKILTIILLLLPILFAIGFSTWVIIYEVVFSPTYVPGNKISEAFGYSQEVYYDGTVKYPTIKEGAELDATLTYKYKTKDGSEFDGCPTDAGVYDVIVFATGKDSGQCQIKFTIKKMQLILTKTQLELDYEKNLVFEDFTNEVSKQIAITNQDNIVQENITFRNGYTIPYIHNGVYYYGEYSSKNLINNSTTEYVFGSTYTSIIELAESLHLNYEFVNNPIFTIKYKTVEVEGLSSYYTIEDALNTGSGNIKLLGNSTGAQTYVTTSFSKLTKAEGNPYNTNNYTLSGRNLIVPYDSSGNTYDKGEKEKGNVYSALIISDNITINLTNSSNLIAAAYVGFKQPNTTISCERGVVINNGLVNVNNGCHVYSYGYIKGNGQINLLNGSIAVDCMSTYDWPGGSAAMAMHTDVMPTNAWSLHNISCITNIYAGSQYKGYFIVNLSMVGIVDTTANIIGKSNDTNCVFKITSGYLRKSVNKAVTWSTNDIGYTSLFTITGSNQICGQRDVIELFGDCQDGKLQMKVGSFISVTMQSSTSIPLPVSFMDIYIKSSSNMTISNSDYLFLPGSKLIIENNATVNVGDGVDISITKWSAFSDYTSEVYSFAAKCVDKQDAKFILNGTLNMNGNIGGNITSEKNGAILNLSNASTTSSYKSLKSPTSDNYYFSNSINAVGNVNHIEEGSFNKTTYISSSNLGYFTWMPATDVTIFTMRFYDDDKTTLLEEMDVQVINDTTYTIVGNEFKPSKRFYNFNQWTDINGKEIIGKTFLDNTQTINLYATWNIREYSLFYTLEYEGENILDSVNFENKLESFTILDFENEQINIATQVSYLDKNFNGWYLGVDSNSVKIDTLTIDILNRFFDEFGDDNSTIPLYGYFSDSKNYTISFVENKFNVEDFEDKVDFSDESILKLPTINDFSTNYDVDTSEQYYFEGWYTASGNMLYFDGKTIKYYIENDYILDSDIVNDTITLYAKFKEKDFQVQYYYIDNVNNSSIEIEEYKQYYNQGQSFILKDSYKRDDYDQDIDNDGENDVLHKYTFQKWIVEDEEFDPGYNYTKGNSNIKIYADIKNDQYVKITFELTDATISLESSDFAFKNEDYKNGEYVYDIPINTIVTITVNYQENDDREWKINGDKQEGTEYEDYKLTKHTKIYAYSKSCITSGTLLTLADGTQKKVEDLLDTDLLLVFNHETGQFEAAPLIFVDRDEWTYYDVVNLEFSNGEITRLIYEHGYFNNTLNKYVYITEDNYQEYIGHEFTFYNGNELEKVTLVNSYITNEYVGCYSPVTAYHLNYFVDGFLSMPGGITGLFNIFEYNEDMTYDIDKMNEDIAKYGLYTYEDFKDYLPYEVYLAFPGPYLKVSVEKGYITFEEIIAYIEQYLGRHGLDK